MTPINDRAGTSVRQAETLSVIPSDLTTIIVAPASRKRFAMGV